MNMRNTTRRSNRFRRRGHVVACWLVFLANSALADDSILVYDPLNHAANILQVEALIEQVMRADTQLELQRRILAHLPVTVADSIAKDGETLQEELSTSFADGGLVQSNAGTQLEQAYPIVAINAAPGWLDAIRPLWTLAERDELSGEQEVYSTIHQGMDPATRRLSDLVEASNGDHPASAKAPGVTATVQAHHELLAACSSETDKLIALCAVRTKRRVERRARRQAQTAYHRARCAALLADWESKPNTQPPRTNQPFDSTKTFSGATR